MNETSDVPSNEAEADALIESIEAPASESAQQPSAPTPAQTAQAEEYSLTVGGKEIKATRDKLLRWAQQGYDAPTKIGNLMKEIDSWKKKESTFSEMQQKYGQVDEYVRQNPQFWQHVLDQWESRNKATADPNNPLAQTVSQLQAQMQDLVQYKQSIENQQKQARMAQEDEAYSTEFNELKAKYPTVDFATPDEEGKTLEYKVLEHATKNGIQKFTTAFRDYYHDELMKISQEQAKEKVIKDKQKNNVRGILGVSSQPTRKHSDDVKGKSYADLAQEALKEFGLN